jgi:hypothetical protein
MLKTTQLFEVVYYDGWSTPPAYYLVGGAEGESPQQALRLNLQRLTAETRGILNLSPDDISDEKIQETLYAIRSDGLVPVRNM